MRRAARLLIALALAGCPFLSACEGSAVEPTVPRAAAAQTRPSLPREIALRGIDPCGLLTGEQRQRLGITSEDSPGPSSTSPSCGFSTEAATLRVFAVTTEGIDGWRKNRPPGRVVRRDPVRGFPAISATFDDDPLRCDTAVGVAAGEHLLASVTAPHAKGHARACQLARQLAEAAMTTLTATH